MPKQLLFFFLFLCNLISYAQIGGRYTYQFLNLVTSPRQAALGGKTITIYDDDVNQAHFNPACINPEMHNNLAVNYGSYFGEVAYGTASYAYTYDRHLQTFQVGMNYVNYGTFEGYDENGLPTANFTGSEAALSLGYAYNIPNSNFFLGASAKLITSSLETYSSFGGAVDFGVLFIDEPNDVNWAFVVRNIGTQFTTYSGIKEKLPMTMMLGVSQELENVPLRWHLTFDNLQQWDLSFDNPNRAQNSLDGSSTQKKTSFFGNALRHTVFGIELFPQKKVNLRLGYNFRRAEELRVVDIRNFSGISAGFGMKFNTFKFNYSYSRYTLAGNTSLFGLTLNFQ